MLDGLWSVVGGSSGSLAYAAVDLPAHLAVCGAILAAVVRLAPTAPSRRFCLAALVASVAIDLDHIPGLFGSTVLDGGLARPFSHTALIVLALAGAGLASSQRSPRDLCLGVALGLTAHLLRDLATGPGVPLVWPASSHFLLLPYAVFAAVLGIVALAPLVAVSLPARKTRRWILAGILTLVALTAVPVTSAASRSVAVGAFIPGADSNPRLISRFDRQVGRRASLILLYKNWNQVPFVREQLDGIWSRGAEPIVTWEPWTFSKRGIPLQAIAAGAYDRYLEAAARAAAAWKRPLMVRFAQEMNGTWFPWSGDASAYRHAWRHVVSVFRRLRATNVLWVWTPVASPSPGSFGPYYPGDRWVNWAGLDGINWGGPRGWVSFPQMFDRSYRELVRISSRPVMLAETGSAERGGKKAGWISAVPRAAIPRMGKVAAVLFWDVADPRGDIRVNSSARALRALRSALRLPLYRGSRPYLQATPSRSRVGHRS